MICLKQCTGPFSMKERERETLWWCAEPGTRKESSPPTGLGLLMSICCALLPTVTNLLLSKSWWLNRVSLSTSDWQKWSWFTRILCEQKWLGFSHLQGPLDSGGGRRLVSAPNSSASFDALDSIFGMGQLCCEWHAYFTCDVGRPQLVNGARVHLCMDRSQNPAHALRWVIFQCAKKNKNSANGSVLGSAFKFCSVSC